MRMQFNKNYNKNQPVKQIKITITAIVQDTGYNLLKDKGCTQHGKLKSSHLDN